MKIKKTVENLLRHCPRCFVSAQKIYHQINNSFSSLSPETPAAILRAFKHALEHKNNDGESIGDYYEFGLFRGYAFLKAFEHTQALGINNVNFYGFDSFEGLPPTEGIDKTDGRFFEGQFACSKQDVEKNLMSNGMDMSRVELIEGYYEASLTPELKQKFPFRPASVILMDCDLYSSTVEALNWVDSYLTDGTIILFDDWFSFGESEELGQQKAAKEFMESRPNYSLHHLWKFCKYGNAFELKIDS